jgi:hypothetical protein
VDIPHIKLRVSKYASVLTMSTINISELFQHLIYIYSTSTGYGLGQFYLFVYFVSVSIVLGI